MEARMMKPVTKGGEKKVVGSGAAEENELPLTTRQCLSS